MKNFLKTIPATCSKAAEKAFTKMECSNVLVRVGFIAQLSFICESLKASQNPAFSVVQAHEMFSEIIEKLIDLEQTGNPVAKTGLEKFQSVFAKNTGLQIAYEKAQGRDLLCPMEVSIYAFAPVTSVEVERFFSILNGFLQDRNNLTEESLSKLVFIKYNSHL